MWPSRCPFCRSHDTDFPYFRPDRIGLLSVLIPRLRRRFCRNCGRHFFAVIPKFLASRT